MSSGSGAAGSSLDAKIDGLLRRTREPLANLLRVVETNVELAPTKTVAHCYVISLSGNDECRVNELAREAVAQMIDYVIPRGELEEARRLDAEDNTMRRSAQLHAKAKQLFAKISKSGEGGELLLYMLAQSFLGYPQLFCKMPHKTSSKMHVHGIDGIHVRFDPSTGRLVLYWGESKLHATVYSAVTECLDSIKPFFENAGAADAAAERDLQLINDNLDLDNEELEEAVLTYLDREGEHHDKLQFRGLCLVGFDHDCYPTEPNKKQLDAVLAEARRALESWKSSIRNQVSARPPLESIDIEIFVLPFPSVEAFREAFKRELDLA